FTASAVDQLLEAGGLQEVDVFSLTTPESAPVQISVTMPLKTHTITAPNVVARLPGRRRDELKDVVLTAHFDHEPPGQPNVEGDSIYNGADDNASGTVGLLEVARAFAALPTPPARSVVFAAVSGEEIGLLGSRHLAQVGPASAEATAANLNMDMLSRNAPDSLLVFGQTYSSLGDLFREILDAHPELGLNVRPGLQMPRFDLIRMGDQASYLERGVPVLVFNSGMHPELHTPDDEIELADVDKLARAARLVFLVAHAVADDPRDPVFTAAGRARAEGMERMRLR
ncbi:MAG: M20/M25/M40 family metallo-hydrolase, partial [Gemmatimonadota bacterium]